MPTLWCHNFWADYQFATFHLEKFHQNLRWIMFQPLKFWSIWHAMTHLQYWKMGLSFYYIPMYQITPSRVSCTLILFKQPQFCLWNWERLNDFDRNYQNLKKLPQYQNNLWNNYKWDFHCIYLLYSKVPQNPTIKQQKIWSTELGNTRSLWKMFKHKTIWITPTILGNWKFILL